MNQEDINKKNPLEITSELLQDPKMLTGLLGLGVCVPFFFPSFALAIPTISGIMIKGGAIVLGGMTTYVSGDLVKNYIKNKK